MSINYECVAASSTVEGNECKRITSKGSAGSSWVSAGMFPQELVFRLRKKESPTVCRVTSMNIREVQFYGCADSTPRKWFRIQSEPSDRVDGERDETQDSKFRLDYEKGMKAAQFIKMVIVRGYGPFVSVSEVRFTSD